MVTPPPNIVTFPVMEGIFGVGRLATQLKALEGANQIGSWHVGHWIDHTHTAISIRFDNGEDTSVATPTVLVQGEAGALDRRLLMTIFRTPTEASGGVIHHGVRYVLGTSLA